MVTSSMSRRTGSGGRLRRTIARIVTPCTTPALYTLAAATVGATGTTYDVSVLANKPYCLKVGIFPETKTLAFIKNLCYSGVTTGQYTLKQKVKQNVKTHIFETRSWISCS